MNRCAYQQRTLVGGCVGVADINMSLSDVVVCPKPRRLGILDTILSKGYDDMETPNFEMASSPPFFFGSPPSRASNPLIQDSQFGNHSFVPVPEITEQAVVAAPPSPPQPSSFNPAPVYGGGCVPMKFGNKPAAVRIEGFNCRNSISAVA